MKIAYATSPYVSFDRAAQDYRTCLRRLGHEVSDNYVDDADLVVLHGEPRQMPGVFDRFPGLLRHRVVGYAARAMWRARSA